VEFLNSRVLSGSEDGLCSMNLEDAFFVTVTMAHAHIQFAECTVWLASV